MRVRRMAVVSSVAVLLAGCGGSKAYVRPGFLDHPPRRVAILPFAITYHYDLPEGQPIPESHQLGREVVRKTFFYGFSTFGYQDLPLEDVDRRLSEVWGIRGDGAWESSSPQALGEALQADALVYGEISRINFFATPFYTETTLAVSLRMVDARTGDILWRKQAKVSERGGAVVQKGQVVDFVKDQLQAYKPQAQFLRVSDAVVRTLLSDMPDPPFRDEADTEGPWASAHAKAKGLRVAVLPLDMKQAKWRAGARQLRRDLAAALQQESPFDVIEPQQVDGAIEPLGWREGEALPESLSISELAKSVGADLVIRGTVTKWGKMYVIAQSWVTAGLKLELIEASTGEILWSREKKSTHTAGILKGPTGYKSAVTAPIKGMKTSNLERVATHLTRDLAQELSRSPVVMTYLSER